MLSSRWTASDVPSSGGAQHLLSTYPLSVLSATAAADAGYGSHKGRVVVVAEGSRPFAPGQLVLSSAPYAVAVEQGYLRRACIGCAAVSDKPYPLACEVRAGNREVPLAKHPRPFPIWADSAR
jgi:hypothetical protein